MGEPRIAVRILGVVSTTRGFAFAVTEGPRRLVDWELRQVPLKIPRAVKVLDAVLVKARPMFLAFDRQGSKRKRYRGRMFAQVVAKACDARGILLLPVKTKQIRMLCDVERPTKWDVAEAVAKLFPQFADKLPSRRKPWQSEDDRIGLFMALAAAVVAWEAFRKPR